MSFNVTNEVELSAGFVAVEEISSKGEKTVNWNRDRGDWEIGNPFFGIEE